MWLGLRRTGPVYQQAVTYGVAAAQEELWLKGLRDGRKRRGIHQPKTRRCSMWISWLVHLQTVALLGRFRPVFLKQ